MNYSDIILAPVVTEKSAKNAEKNVYTFKVVKTATKTQIKWAIENAFGVKVKTRSEVSGGGRKPWKQKGTGRARAGSSRSPLWRGGGIVFGPTPRDYSFKINKKERTIALKSALTEIAKEKALVVVDKIELASLKTIEAKKLIESLKLTGNVLFITNDDNENLFMACRNLGYAQVLLVDEVNVLDLVYADYVVI